MGVGQDNTVWKISKVDRKIYKAFDNSWSEIGEEDEEEYYSRISVGP